MPEQDNTEQHPPATEQDNTEQHPPATETAKPRTLVYMPLPDDPDETESAGVKFKAYEQVELPPSKAFLADKFATNAWFAPTLEGVDAERKAKWEKARKPSAAAEAKQEAPK